MVEYLSSAKTTRVSGENLEWAINTMNNMNTRRTEYNDNLIPAL